MFWLQMKHNFTCVLFYPAPRLLSRNSSELNNPNYDRDLKQTCSFAHSWILTLFLFRKVLKETWIVTNYAPECHSAMLNLWVVFMICLYKSMPEQLWMTHSPAEADTPVLAMVLLWEVFFIPYAAKKKFNYNKRWRITRDLHTPKHFKNFFSFSIPRTTQKTKSFPRKQISSASALGAVPAHAKQRKCSSVSLHTTLCHRRRGWWESLCQDELSSHDRKGGRRKHTLVTLTLSPGLLCCWPAEAAVAFWAADEELGDRLFWTPNTAKKNIAVRVIGFLQCRWHSG